MKNSFYAAPAVMLALCAALFSCNSTQNARLTGSVSVVNKCGGTIDTVVIRIKTYTDKNGLRPIFTDTVAVVDNMAKFDSTFALPEEANLARIIDVVTTSGAPVCSFKGSACATGKTCANTAGPGNIAVDFSKEMKYKVECNCK